jgi:hypothetical protein
MPGSRSPALATLGEIPHLVWTQEGVLYHASRTAEGWSAPVRVASGHQSALAAAADGRLHCLFVHQFMGNAEIYHVAWNGVQWTLPQPVSRTSGASANPTLAVAPDGSLHAVWTDNTPGYATIYHGCYAEAQWSSLPIPNARGAMPALAITPNGDLYAAWQGRLDEGGRYDIFCAVRHGTSWGLPEDVSDSPEQHSIFASLATNVQGGCHLVWQEEQEGLYHIRHSDRRPGGWANPVVISSSDEDCRLPRIAAIRQGFLEVIWQEGEVLRHRVRPPDYETTWWAPEDASVECQGLGSLALAISPTGRVHVAWSGPDESGAPQLYYVQRAPLFKFSGFVPMVG